MPRTIEHSAIPSVPNTCYYVSRVGLRSKRLTRNCAQNNIALDHQWIFTEKQNNRYRLLKLNINNND